MDTQLTQWRCFAQTVEGIVVDVGWYRTTIRSFEREIFCIPNSVFSRNVVLNVTRKQREWRFYEFIGNLFCRCLISQARQNDLHCSYSQQPVCRSAGRRHWEGWGCSCRHEENHSARSSYHSEAS